MNELNKLFERIIQKVNINLRELHFDVRPFTHELLPPDQLSRFYAFYGITPDHPLDLSFKHSALAGSYFLGKCSVANSLLYKTDIRGDELKRNGQTVSDGQFSVELTTDEMIDIRDSLLVKTLVHNFSHDLECPETFSIYDTLAMDYSNIHGAPINGCFLGPFATVDLTTVHDCVIGAYSYIQAGEIGHMQIDPGTIWVRSPENFNFLYRYPAEELASYISLSPEQVPWGKLIDFIDQHKDAFNRVFDVVNLETISSIPETASLDRYAVVLPSTSIGEKVLVSQRAYLENSSLGEGANAQENCFIINSSLKGFNVSAHGSKIIETDLEMNVFTGFNSFVCGRPDGRISVGENCIIMPHTIIDVEEALEIPADHLVWGLIRNSDDLEANSISLKTLENSTAPIKRGTMHFEGNGSGFVGAFKERIHHILEVNGAFFDGEKGSGHAQRNQKLSLNTIQPFQFGEKQGLYPSIRILP